MVIFTIRLFNQFSSHPFVNENLSLITAVILLYVPMAVVIRNKEKIDYLDRSLGDVFYSLKILFFFSLAIFPFVFMGNDIFQGLFNLTYHPATFTNWVTILIFQILMIALPEEFFFRGYFLGRLNQVYGRTWRLLGASFGPGLFISSFLFAMSHTIIQYQWWQIFIFFPALAFGWLKERTGTILAPILFHALCNFFAQWVAVHY